MKTSKSIWRFCQVFVGFLQNLNSFCSWLWTEISLIKISEVRVLTVASLIRDAKVTQRTRSSSSPAIFPRPHPRHFSLSSPEKQLFWQFSSFFLNFFYKKCVTPQWLVSSMPFSFPFHLPVQFYNKLFSQASMLKSYWPIHFQIISPTFQIFLIRSVT